VKYYIVKYYIVKYYIVKYYIVKYYIVKYYIVKYYNIDFHNYLFNIAFFSKRFKKHFLLCFLGKLLLIRILKFKMFYLTEVEDHVRVEPKLFGLPTSRAVFKQLIETYNEYYDKEVGKVVTVIEVLKVGDGVIIPGDGAVYYESRFKLLTWKPELHELVYGVVDEITNFGAFMNLGMVKGLIHIGQTMDDFVSLNKTSSLTGKKSKRTLKKGDLCIARIVAISHKGGELKVGLTMRQPGLGKIEWIKEDNIKREKAAKFALKTEEKTAKESSKKGGKKKKNE